MKQVFNPYLPSYEYVPDGEPHVFGDRVYVYGSHDRFNGGGFCLNDYVCYSAPADDLKSWRYEGVIYRRAQDPYRAGRNAGMAAPDVAQGPDGRYYLYYFLGGNGRISVAVCDTPAGKYEYLGPVKYADGTAIGEKGEPFQFDPGVLVDDDGEIYLYSGFGIKFNPFLTRKFKATRNGPMLFRLEKDMVTVKQGPDYIGVGPWKSKGTGYEGHEFLEASSPRKYEGKYYFVYSSLQSHELCYAVSDRPDGGFQYGGVIVSNGDIGLCGRTKKSHAVNFTGNTHGGLLRLNGKYYTFYHRQTNRYQFSRQACAEEIRFENGRFHQAEMTSCGLNGGPLEGKGTYEARIACHLTGKWGTLWYLAFKHPKLTYPYFTQDGQDREENPNQHIANFCDGATAGFKYFAFEDAKTVSVQLRGRAEGTVTVSLTPGGEPVAAIPVSGGKGMHEHSAPLKPLTGTHPLYFTYYGKGHPDFFAFTLA